MHLRSFLHGRRPLASLIMCVLWLWGAMLSCQSLRAQDGDENRPPAAPEAELIPPVGGDHIIYVPFSRLDGVFEKPDSTVVLPYAEYLKLKKQWEESQKPATSPDVVLTRADYVAVVEKDFVRLTLKLQVNVLGKAWSGVPVSFGAAAIGKVEGTDVMIRGTGQEGSYELLFGQAGEQTVTLELGTRVHQSPEGRQFNIAIPAVGIQTLDITVPGVDQDIAVIPGGRPLEGAAAPENATRLYTTMASGIALQVNWRAKASLKPEMDLLASVNNLTQVSIADGLIHTDATLTYDVLRGKLSQFQIAIPLDHRILDISANSQLRGWKPSEVNGRQVVDIDLLTPSEQPVRLEVHTQRKLPDGVFDVIGQDDAGELWGIHALDAVRESGQVVVRHSPDLTISQGEQSGLIRMESNAVESQLQGNNALAFKFYSPKVRLQLSVKPVEPRVTATHGMELVFMDDELRLNSSLQYLIERAGVFERKLQLPEDFVIDSVNCPAMKDYAADNATRILTINLAERTLGNLVINIQGHRNFSASTNSTEQQLPLIEPLQVERETGTVLIFAKEAIEVVTNREGLVGAQPLPTPPQARDEARLASAWNYTRRPLTIPVSTVRKPTRISADIASKIDVQPEVTEVEHTVDFLVEFAGADAFHVRVPEAANDKVRIDVASGSAIAIKQKTAADPVDGWVEWTIIMQREVVGHQRFTISWHVQSGNQSDTAASADATAATPANADEQYLLVRPRGLIDDTGTETTPLSKVYGEVAITKERSLSLTTTALGGEIEPIDIRELRLLPQEGTQAYRYFKLPDVGTAVVTISRTRHEIQEVVATVVSRALVEIVTGEDKEANYRCRMQLKSTERQRLLVQLPLGLRVLGAFVNEREIKLEKAVLPEGETSGALWEPYWVNVARTGSSDEPFLLTFQFLWNVDPALGDSQFGRGRLKLPLPMIGGAGKGSAIQELKTVIWVPAEFTLVGDPEDFKLHQIRQNLEDVLLGSRADQQVGDLNDWVLSGVSSSSGFLQFPTQGRQPYLYTNLGGASQINVIWWHRMTMTLIFSGAVALIALILLGTPWENKLSILLLATFACILYGVQDSHGLWCGIEAAQYGIGLLVAMWVLHGLMRLARCSKPSSGPTPVPLGPPPAPPAPPAPAPVAPPPVPASGPQNPVTPPAPDPVQPPPVVPPPGSFDDPWNFGKKN